MLAKDVMSHVADPHLEADSIVLFRHWTCEDIGRACTVMRLHYEFGDE
jgi:hypothetical protein